MVPTDEIWPGFIAQVMPSLAFPISATSVPGVSSDEPNLKRAESRDPASVFFCNAQQSEIQVGVPLVHDCGQRLLVCLHLPIFVESARVGI